MYLDPENFKKISKIWFRSQIQKDLFNIKDLRPFKDISHCKKYQIYEKDLQSSKN